MQLTENTKLKDILAAYPWLIDDAAAIDSRFQALRSPLGKALIGRSSIADAARKVGVTPQEVIEKIQELIANHGA